MERRKGQLINLNCLFGYLQRQGQKGDRSTLQKSKRIRAVMKEQEQTKGRISIKEKLAEKKAVIEQRDKAERTSPEKETEKKSQREM